MKVVVLGSTGMLGQAIMEVALQRNILTFGISKHSKQYPLDITNEKILIDTLSKIHPDVIINTAALVNIEACEKDPGLAYLMNARVTHTLSQVARTLDAYLIHISTDHYFTGDKNIKHNESAKVTLVNEYARTKYAGEVFALLDKNTLVVRTNILGFRNKADNPTFIEWVIQSLKNATPMVLFSDYFISGIHVSQLAKALFDIVSKGSTGIRNVASRDVYSKKELIELIASRLKLSLKNAKVGSVFETMKVRRAESLGLDVSFAEKVLGYKLPTLKQVVDSIIDEYKARKYEI